MRKSIVIEMMLVGYNALLMEGGLQPYSMYGVKRLAAGIIKFHSWCEGEGVDPLLYMRARLEANQWNNRIPFNKLASRSFLCKFKDMGENRQLRIVTAQRDAAEAQDCPRDTSSMGPELHVLAETVKRTYARSQDHDLCMLSAENLTLGWNPRSEWCKQCPLAAQCQQALPEAVRQQRYAAG